MSRIWIVLAVFAAGAAQASSDDAWAAFRVEVAAACRALPDVPEGAAVEVSDFGSESFGVALITSVAEGVVQRQVCIFDKVSKKAELAALGEAP